MLSSYTLEAIRGKIFIGHSRDGIEKAERRETESREAKNE